MYSFTALTVPAAVVDCHIEVASRSASFDSSLTNQEGIPEAISVAQSTTKASVAQNRPRVWLH